MTVRQQGNVLHRAAERDLKFPDHVSHINWQTRVAHQSSDHIESVRGSSGQHAQTFGKLAQLGSWP